MSRNSSSPYSNPNWNYQMAPPPLLVPPTPTPLSLPVQALMINSGQLQPSLYGQGVNNQHQHQHQHQLNTSYDTSKSMMFGIPRDCPRPTVTLDSDTLHLNKQLCDISLNTEDMSMYQQMQLHLRPAAADTFTFAKKLPNDSIVANPKPILKNSTERLNSSMNQVSYLPAIQQPKVDSATVAAKATAAVTVSQDKLLENNQSLFLLDEYMDKNVSMNTKALAMKYLKNGSAKAPTSMLSMDKSAAANAFNHKPFQYYEYKSTSNSTTLFKDEISGVNLFKKMDNLYKNYQDNNDLSDINLSSLTVTSLPPSTNHKYQYRCYLDSATGDKNSNDGDENDDQDNDDDLWVFGKPDGKKDYKTIKKKEKDFSDEDSDVERDVTTVLDIEKLKRLPKLL